MSRHLPMLASRSSSEPYRGPIWPVTVAYNRRLGTGFTDRRGHDLAAIWCCQLPAIAEFPRTRDRASITRQLRNADKRLDLRKNSELALCTRDDLRIRFTFSSLQ